MVGYALVACGYHMKHQKSSLVDGMDMKEDITD